MRVLIFPFLFFCSCSVSKDSSKDSATTAPTIESLHLPEHSECLTDIISAEVCLSVVEEDQRQPTVSFNQSGKPLVEEDSRLENPDYIWLTEEIKKCTCVCCHSSDFGGPGAYFWDIDFLPVWIDSANSWTLFVLAGETEEPDQTLPLDDIERVKAIIEYERERRMDN